MIVRLALRRLDMTNWLLVSILELDTRIKISSFFKESILHIIANSACSLPFRFAPLYMPEALRPLDSS